MEALMTADGLFALLTLSAMEIVLGIDNIIFISILVGKLPEAERGKIRSIGISLALVIRILLLFSISWIMKLSNPLFEISNFAFSGRDLILLGGGLFLIAKATFEIHGKVEGGGHDIPAPGAKGGKSRAASMVLFQILILDIVFSLDSVITAVGMADQISIMVVAMLIAMIVMLISAGAISTFVDRHPTIKILALAFLILIGVMLTAEGLGTHVSKGYIYFAMFFSLGVEMLNMRFRHKATKKKSH